MPLREVLAESFPWCAEHREALAEMFRAYGARKRELGRARPRRPAAVLARAAADERDGPRDRGASSTCSWTSTRTSTALQVDIVRGLRAGRPGLTVVGDDFQAIYGFRAASARHILEFPSAVPGGAHGARSSATTARPQPILAVANAVSAQDRRGFPKVLWSERDGRRGARARDPAR